MAFPRRLWRRCFCRWNRGREYLVPAQVGRRQGPGLAWSGPDSMSVNGV